jgi:hypothetical protein
MAIVMENGDTAYSESLFGAAGVSVLALTHLIPALPGSPFDNSFSAPQPMNSRDPFGLWRLAMLYRYRVLEGFREPMKMAPPAGLEPATR